MIKRNMAMRPAYTVALALVAALGYMALASNVADNPAYADGFERYGPNYAVPALFLHWFPSWFAGVGFAAIAIGALVPAAIMSIAAANLYTRNIHKEYFRPNCSPKNEADVAKLASLLVKFGALIFILALPQQYAIQLQLLGGIWIIQTLPAVMIGLYTRRLYPNALIIAWVVGMGSGTWMAASQGFSSNFPLPIGGSTLTGYAAIYALILNLTTALILSAAATAMGAPLGTDLTKEEDYAVAE